MDIEIINSQTDYKKALRLLSELMDNNPLPGSEDDNTLSLLLLVIQDYEQRNIAPICPSPIDAIKFRMEQMQLSRKELIPYIGSISKVSEVSKVLSGRRNLSLPMIRKLHQGLGIPLGSLVLGVVSPSPKRRKARKPIRSTSIRRRRKILSRKAR